MPDPTPTPDAARAPALPSWLPPVVFAALTLFIFRDFVLGGEMLFGMDTEGMGYMARAFFAEELARGNFPGWAPRLLGGTPFLESLAGGDSLYPPSLLLLLVMEPYRALGWKLVLHVFLAGVGMYGWTRSLGVSRAAGMVAGVGFLVAPFLVTLVYPGHDGKIFVTALAPFLFWAVERWYAGGSGRAWAAIATVVALVILTTHFQMAYFLFGAAGAYAIHRAVSRWLGERRGESVHTGTRRAAPAFGLFLAAAVTGAGVAGVQFLPAAGYITEFSRRTATTTEASPEQNRAYAASWSLHPEEAVSLVIPEFVGNDAGGSQWATGTYWGRNAFKLNHEYLGLGVLLLALLAFVGGPRRGERRFFLALGLIALLYALGAHTPVWHFFFAVLPGIKLFRAPSMAIFLTGMAVCTLSAFGVDRIAAWLAHPAEEGAARGMRVLWGGVGVTVVLLLLAASGGLVSLWTGTVYDGGVGRAALTVAEPFIVRGSMVAALVALTVALTVFIGRRGSIPAPAAVAILTLVVSADGIRVDETFVQTRDFYDFHRSGSNIDGLVARQQTETPFRVLDLSEPQIGQGVRSAMFGLELASGHHPNDMARYRELTGMVGGGAPENLLQSPNLLAILNVRYIIWPVRRFGTPEGLQPVSATQLANGELYEAVYTVQDLPRARLVAQAEVVTDEDAVARLMDPAFEVATTVTTAEPLPSPLAGGVPDGSVEWLERGTDRQELRVSTDRASLLVVADNWHPGWKAAVDGETAPVLRVNHTLRAVPLDPGEHAVVMEFRSDAVRTGFVVSLASLLLVVGVAGRSFLNARAPVRGENGTEA